MNCHALAEAYIAYLNSLGQTDVEVSEGMDSVFAPDIKKYENGTLIASGYDGLTAQLSAVKAAAAPWQIAINYIIAEENQAVVQFNGTAHLIGDFMTAARLTFDEDGKISEIWEVFHMFTPGASLPHE